MGNADSNVTCEGVELQPVHTWWGRSYRKPHQPMSIQNQTQKLDLNLDFGSVFTRNIFENSWPNASCNNLNNREFLSVKNGSLSSEETLQDMEKYNLSSNSCQDSGFGESFPVPSPVSSSDLVLGQDFVVGTSGEREEQRKMDVFRTRIRKLSDWTGSLRIKKRRVQDPDPNSNWSSNPLQNQALPQILVQNQDQTRTILDPGFSVYQNFRQDLDSKSTLGSTKTSSDRDSVDQGDQGLGPKPGLDPGLDSGQSLERGVVRRAGWIWIKPLIKPNKDRLEQVPRRRWKKHWVKLKGCWLQFFLSPGPDPDLELSLIHI